MIRLNKIQKEHREWQFKNFGKVPIEESFMGMVEELGELSHAILKERQGIRVNENHEENAIDAIGDIIIYIISLCNSKDWDLETIIETTWDSVKERDWIKYPETGRPSKEYAHKNTPCEFCGIPHDEVEPGSCPGPPDNSHTSSSWNRSLGKGKIT
jgi:NTP pyrophosphatase (non-canonical NTP hydrolase)